MAGFVASPPPPADGSPDQVEADDWFPSISLQATRDSMRVGTVVTDARLRDAILGGMISAMNDLADWQAVQIAAGVTSLAAVAPNVKLGGTTRLEQLWRRAVGSYAAADLAETHRTVGTTADWRVRNLEEEPVACDHRRNALAAVRDMIGETRTWIALL